MCCAAVVSGSGSGSVGTRSSLSASTRNFHNRGRRSEQVQVMQQLWAEPHVTYEGRWHRIEDAGINPRPASGRVPVWFGGHHERTLERIAKVG